MEHGANSSKSILILAAIGVLIGLVLSVVVLATMPWHGEHDGDEKGAPAISLVSPDRIGHTAAA